MPSFDVVCQVDLQEIDNAVNQAAKEIASRFDFRGGNSSIKLDKNTKQINIVADDELKLRAIHTILEIKVAKREMDCRMLAYEDPRESGMKQLQQKVNLRSGLSKEEAKKLVKSVKEAKLKVQAQIKEDEVRVSGKKIDDLQQVIAYLKEHQAHLPLQFINMRS